VRGAINNGLTKVEISEALLQVAIYAGVPAALDAYRVAQDVFGAIESEGDQIA
jgi:4-carboxymuconolactone decarboxylase